MNKVMTTEEAIDEMQQWLNMYETATATEMHPVLRSTNTKRNAALRHIISEARKVEALREWTKKGYKFFPEMIDGFEWAQCEVQDILNAPDTGGK